MGVASLSEYLDTSERSGGKKMAAILGRNLSVTLDLGDGREYKLESGMITNIEISNTVDDLSRFGMDIIGSPIIIPKPVQTNITLSGIYEGSGMDELFAYTPDEEKIKKSGLIHGEHYCAYCGSDWLPDSRGNCGACGGSKHRGKMSE